MMNSCENSRFVEQCKIQVVMYQENKFKSENGLESTNIDSCSDNISNYILYSLYAFIGASVIRLYFVIMAMKWLCKGSATDEKEDRYDLVLGFSGLAISTLIWSVAPLFVGFYLDVSNSIWIEGMLGFLVDFLIKLYWRFVMVLYYEAKDVEIQEELELEEKNLNAKREIQNVSFSSNTNLVPRLDGSSMPRT